VEALQAAIADAGLGRADVALARIDALLARFADTNHPLVHGLLHETRARIACGAGGMADYVHSLSEVERWFRPTGNPVLIAMYEELARLRSVSGQEAAAVKIHRTIVEPTRVEPASDEGETTTMTGSI